MRHRKLALSVIGISLLLCSAFGDECTRHGPEVEMGIMVTMHGDLGPVMWLDTCVEWRECKNDYMVKFPGVRGWVPYPYNRYHIEQLSIQEEKK